MEFDKNKILTVVTVGQAKVGMKGWFGNNMLELEDQCKYESPSKLTTLCHGFMKAFEKDNGLVYHLFYPVPEPTYRPYNNDELNDLVGEALTNKQSGRRKLVTGKPTASEGVNLDGSYINARDLFYGFYRNGNEPCGVKEEV